MLVMFLFGRYLAFCLDRTVQFGEACLCIMCTMYKLNLGSSDSVELSEFDYIMLQRDYILIKGILFHVTNQV